MNNHSLLAIPVVLAGVLALAIVLITWRYHPWRHLYGTPAWDFSSSFATNLAVLTAALNALLQLAASGTKSPELLLQAAAFAVITASAPLIASAWKHPGNQIYFGGAVAAIVVTAVGALGQIQLLTCLLKEYLHPALYFAEGAVFVYCLATANVLARTPVPSAVVQGFQGPSATARWALP